MEIDCALLYIAADVTHLRVMLLTEGQYLPRYNDGV